MITDRHGGQILEYVARPHPRKPRNWEVCARTQSYGGSYYVPIDQIGGKLVRYRRKRDAVAAAATLNSDRIGS